LKIQNEQVDSVSRRLKALLLPISVLVGLNTQPTDLELSLIAQYLKEMHPLLTIEEIIVAMKLNCSGHFNKKIEHFQTFSGSYISDVVNLYLDEKMATIKKINEIKASEEQKKRDEEYLESIKDQTAESHWNITIDTVKKTGYVPHGAKWSMLFDYLYYDKRHLVPEYLKEFMSFEKPKIIGELTLQIRSARNSVERADLEAKLTEEALKEELRKRVVIKYIRENFLDNAS
jgi:RNase H-fold protein (predicted Holliday junction resolvase)